MTVSRRAADAFDELGAALAFPFTDRRRAVGTVLVAAVTFVVLVVSTFPAFAVQMLGAGLGYLDYVVVSLVRNTYRTSGAVGLALVVGYALLTGVAVTNAAAQLRLTGVSGLSDLSGVVPGLLASGCASCGAGILGVLGFAGALAVLPFHGNLLRLGGVLLLTGFLARSGDPRECTV
ncbi:hypothetical protein [Halorarius halobius]|uniref:hypothetical protein n=1 Tax=Halorarius halobius TaxID=2962671 RepID=UPI0020CE5587|nr:hypothetical protein [Halorarius halobius]